MKIPLLGSLGIDSQTGVLIAIAGLATLFLVNKFGTSGAPQPIPAGPVVKGPSEIYPVGDDGILQRMGWTVPTMGSKDYGDEARTTRKTFDADIRSRYEIGHPSAGGLTFLNDAQRHVSNSEYAYAARAYDTTTTDATTTSTSTTPATTDPKIVELQNKILKMIVSGTTNVSTVLSNMDTIKANILTYTAKLQLAQQQLDARVITPSQMDQYLSSIVQEIATNLQITLNPSFIGGNSSVPDYYQKYYQDYQNYINQLNSNYYQYYQPSYQYYPGQQYNYYQPYQYQYPNPYMSSGQYPVNYPYYGYYQQQPYYPDYSQQIDLYYQQPQQSGGLINIGTGGGGGLINIGTGGGLFGGLFG